MIKKCNKKNIKNNQTKNSLIEISKLVLDYIKEKDHKTGNQITEYVINYLKPENDDKAIQKNIQRRVYDSINVMNSIGIIKKNKQDIKYTPIKKNNESNRITNTNQKKNNQFKNQKDNDEIKLKNLEYLNKINELKKLQKVLIQKYITLKCYEYTSKINNINEDKNIDNYFHNKFLTIKIDNEYNPKIKSKEIKISPNNDIPNDIIKNKTAQEILIELNSNFKKINNNEGENSSNKFQKMKNNKKEEENINFFENKQKINNYGNMIEKNLNEDIVFSYLKQVKLL